MEFPGAALSEFAQIIRSARQIFSTNKPSRLFQISLHLHPKSAAGNAEESSKRYMLKEVRRKVWRLMIQKYSNKRWSHLF
jgi:hypothetical protein